LGLAFGAARALADPPPVYSPPAEIASEPPAPEGQPTCPVLELEPFEGEDMAAGEVRSLRGESAEGCAALSDRLDRLRERVWWAVLELASAAKQRALTNEKLDLVLEAMEEPTCPEPCPVLIEAEGPIEVQDAASKQYSDKLVSAVDASGEATSGALWWLGGIVVAFFVGLMLAKTVDRGT